MTIVHAVAPTNDATPMIGGAFVVRVDTADLPNPATKAVTIVAWCPTAFAAENKVRELDERRLTPTKWVRHDVAVGEDVWMMAGRRRIMDEPRFVDGKWIATVYPVSGGTPMDGALPVNEFGLIEVIDDYDDSYNGCGDPDCCR